MIEAYTRAAKFKDVAMQTPPHLFCGIGVRIGLGLQRSFLL